MKHTPGPWNMGGAIKTERGRVYGINARVNIEGFNGPQDCRIAEVFSIKANARLIARTPELLEHAQYIDYAGPELPNSVADEALVSINITAIGLRQLRATLAAIEGRP
jgi:hypothetical protein